MKKATVIRDKLSGQPFAILLPSDGKKPVAFGSSGQGRLWADWAMSSSSGALDNLDVSLTVEKDVELTDEFINSLESTFELADLNELKFTISKKALLVIEKVKSLAGEEPAKYEQMNEDNEEELVDRWPVVDAAIATIDVAYKQNALDYKAKAFNLDSKRSSMLLQVKGVRAMWDPNMPGGGGWRCPDETVNGGQFTNRLGRGCTFGAIRRIGRALMTASLKDIAKGFDDDEVAFPSVYRAGKKLDEVGEKLKERTGKKYSRRAMRRADQLKKEQARRMLKESRPTFRQRYESLGPTVSRRNRVLIAASQTARDVADDQATRGFVSEARRRTRRQGIPTRKTPTNNTETFSNDDTITGAMSPERRAQIAEKLRTTAQDIYEGRRFARRQKKSERKQTKNSPQLNEAEIERSNRVATKQIDSILGILKQKDSGREYLAGVVNSAVKQLTNWAGEKTDGLGFQSVRNYTKDDFDDNDVRTIERALRQLKENPDRPFAEQQWGRFSQLFKLWGTYNYQVDRGSLYNSDGNLIADYIPRLKKPSGQADVFPELWIDGRSVGEFELRTPEELTELNNAYATLGFLDIDTKGPDKDQTLSMLGEFYSDEQGDVFGDYYRQLRADESKFSVAAREVVVNGLKGNHARDLRKFLHNKFYGSTAWNSPKKTPNRETEITPSRSIVERFMRGLSPSRDKEQRTLERELRGKTPRSTTELRERIARRQRRRAKEQSGELVTFEDYADYEQLKINRPEPVGGKRKLNEFTEPAPPERTRSRARARWMTKPSGEGRPKVDIILRDMEPHFSASGDVNENTIKGLDDLDRFFQAEVNHAAIARLRESALTPYDMENQGELKKIYNDWLRSFNDPDADPQPGSPSNMGLTEQTSVSWVVPGEPGFLTRDLDVAWKFATTEDADDIADSQRTLDAVGDRIVLRANQFNGRPVVYVEDTEAQVAHLMTPDGRHLMSIVTSRDDSDEPGKVRFIGGSAALEQIARTKMRPTVSERMAKLTGRNRRRTASLSKPVEQAKAKNRLDIGFDNGKPVGLFFGKTSTGRRLTSRAQEAMTGSELEEINKLIDQNLDILENNLRNRLGYPDLNQPISTVDAVARIEEVRKTSPRFAGVLETDLHNMIALSRARESNDIIYINDLKPALRNKILENVWSSYLQVGGDSPKRYDVVPHQGKPEAAKKVTKLPQKAPLMVSESSLAPDPSTVGTGPDLTPGVGNAQLGIEYEASTGLYKDSVSLEYIEDYSKLPIEQTAIYDPVLPDETKTYPRVSITPAGVFPTRFATLAPEVNPDGDAIKPGDVATRTFKDAIEAYISSRVLTGKAKTDPAAAAVDRILGRNVEAESLRANILARVDARGYKPTKMNGDPVLSVPPTLGQLTFAEMQALANSSIESNPDSSITDLGLTFSSVSPNAELGSIAGKRAFEDVFRTSFIDGLGLDMDLEPSLFYIPSESVKGNDINEMLVDINRALQLQNAADLQRASLSGSFSDAKAAKLQQLQDEANDAWQQASKTLSTSYRDAATARNDALAILSDNPKNKSAMSMYLQMGARAEAAKMLLDRHITSNQVALDAITAMKRAELEGMAKSRNQRKRAMLDRVKARANKGIPRNEGAFDATPELLDPWGTATPPLQPRSLDDILAVRAQHRAEGLYDDPTQGIAQLAEEQIDALVAMDVLQKKAADAMRGNGDGSDPSKFTGMENTPMYGADFNYTQLADVQVAHFWYYNGSSSLPVLVNQEELDEILTSVDSSGNRRALVITRGVKAPTGTTAEKTAQEEEWVNMALRGDRFVPGAGGKAEGHGEYWTFNPGGGWSSYHGGHGGTMIAVITDQSEIFHKDVFHALFSGNSGQLYENLWGIYNAIGAPDSTGVNASHGQQVARLLAPNSVLPDANTGQFTATQIAQLEDVVQQLTAIGPDLTVRKSSRSKLKALDISDAWGAFTLEGLYRDSPLGTRPPNRGMSQSAWEDMFRDVRLKPDTPENIRIIEETKALRQKVNAWYAQHLSWFVQLAQMRQDESQPGQAGIDAKKHNTRLNSAMRSILYLGAESRASMLGVDALIPDVVQTVLPSELFQAISRPDNPAGDRVLMMNRSGMIMLRTGIKHYTAITNHLRNLQVQSPNGTAYSPIKDRNW
jgi:hypothetical protein